MHIKHKKPPALYNQWLYTFILILLSQRNSSNITGKGSPHKTTASFLRLNPAALRLREKGAGGAFPRYTRQAGFFLWRDHRRDCALQQRNAQGYNSGRQDGCGAATPYVAAQ
jgi:hypothetical protein